MIESLTNNNHIDFCNSLISGNRVLCSKLVQKYLNDKLSINELYENIIKKSLYDIGEMWEYNKISVSTEHMASAIVEAILNELYPTIISNDKTEKKIIVSCVENEFHQIGIKMINDVFEMNGWNSYFLGANTPTNELISFVKRTNPDMLAISLSIYFHLPALENMIQLVRKEFPILPILVGGQAFLHGSQNILNKYDNVVYKADLKSTELFIKSYKNG